jgi:Holliday junction DNA helicase RuvA
MAILAGSPINRIEQAISNGQTSLFEAISGIGKKVAAKIIVELKGKVGGQGPLLPSEGGDSSLLDALESLGYRKAEVLPILNDLPTSETTLEKQIRWVLKQMKTKA